MRTTVKIVLDSKPLSSGKYAIYLRVLKNRKKKNINLGIQCLKSNFNNEMLSKKQPNYQIENEILLHHKSKAMKIIRNFQINEIDFTLKEFEEEFLGKKKNNNNNMIEFINEIENDMKKVGKYSSAKVLKGTKNSLIKFKGKKITFRDVDVDFLEKYEIFLRENGNADGGVSFKMRELRAVYNKAINKNIVSKDFYPFDKYKVSKLKSRNIKLALTIDEFKKIRDVDLSEYPHLADAQRFFVFSVFTRGMNFKDMMDLKWKNIKNDRIYYVRSKTNKSINLKIIPQVQKILDYYKAQNRETEYVFPILLSDDMTPQQTFNRRHKILSRYNKNLKEISEIIGLNKNLHSYVARHSFATISKMIGTSIEAISEMMGHSNVSITIAYLKEFSNEMLDEENSKFSEL